MTADLEAIAREYDPSDRTAHFDYWLKRLQARCIEPWIRGRRALELGCATGELTRLLRKHFDTYEVVEGSTTNIEVASARCPETTFTHSMWEDFVPWDGGVTDIVMTGALEHADDPEAVLVAARRWLVPDGRIHITVPNGLSLHRLIGVEMEMQADAVALTAGDIAQGHQRNFSIDSLHALIRATGGRLVHAQPIFMKLVPNTEMLGWEWPLILATHAIAQRFPEHGAELYAVVE